jgi:hypothetical protein
LEEKGAKAANGTHQTSSSLKDKQGILIERTLDIGDYTGKERQNNDGQKEPPSPSRSESRTAPHSLSTEPCQ